MPRASDPVRIDVLAYDGCFAAEIVGLMDVLTIANAVSAALMPGTNAPFQARITSVRGGQITAAGGIVLSTHAARRRPDQLVVPGFAFAQMDELEDRLGSWSAELAYLRRTADGTVRIASVCVGAFLLGEAGLLDGRAVTTSWLFASQLARRYPKATVHTTDVIAHDGMITTAGAFSAGHDLELDLVRGHAGDKVARATSNLTLLPARRTTQAPFVDETLMLVPHATFADDVRNWLRRRLSSPYDLDQLATAFNVSPRTMLRRFAAQTGQTPLSFLQGARVAAARRLLENSELSVGEITRQVGYGDAPTFRKLFIAVVGLAPSEYRRQFGRQRPPPDVKRAYAG